MAIACRPVLVLGLALAAFVSVPAASGAKPPPPPPQLDTANATGDNLVLDDFSSFGIDVQAFSGPSGENPGGRVSFEAGALRLPVSGAVTCLSVSGNTAVMTVTGPFPAVPFFPALFVKLVDNGGGGLDRFQYFPADPALPLLDCGPASPADFGGPLIGRATVSDVPPPPTTKDQCRNGGYTRYGFRSIGQCISYLNGVG